MFMMNVLFSARSGVAFGRLGLSERSREITVQLYKVISSLFHVVNIIYGHVILFDVSNLLSPQFDRYSYLI
jgi:hypothetical protein